MRIIIFLSLPLSVSVTVSVSLSLSVSLSVCLSKSLFLSRNDSMTTMQQFFDRRAIILDSSMSSSISHHLSVSAHRVFYTLLLLCCRTDHLYVDSYFGVLRSRFTSQVDLSTAIDAIGLVDVELTIPHDTGWNTIWTLTVVVLFIQFLHKLYSVCARVFVCVRVCVCVCVCLCGCAAPSGALHD